MQLTLPGRVVLLDFGEVISLPQSEAMRTTLESTSGVAPDRFWPQYWAFREALDHGRLTVEGYWESIADALGVRWSASTIQCLWSADFRGWLEMNPHTLDLVEGLDAGGTRMALLSNAGLDYVSAFRHSPMSRFFERVFVSAELRCVKPDPALFLWVAAELTVAPSAVVFVDNKQENVDGAAAVGMTAHRYVGTSSLLAFLRELAA